MNNFNNHIMNKETTNRKNYEKPAIQEIQMVENARLLSGSNYDG